MEKIENATISLVKMSDDLQSVELMITKEGSVYPVTYHLGKYNSETKSFTPDPDTEAKRREQVKEDLDVVWEELPTTKGKEVTVYVYTGSSSSNGFNSLHEVNYAEPYSEDQVDQMIEFIVDDINYNENKSLVFTGEETGTGIRRSAKMNFTAKLGDDYFLDVQKRERQLAKLLKITNGMTVEDLQNSDSNLKLTGQVAKFNEFTFVKILKIEKIGGTVTSTKPTEQKDEDDDLPF